MEGYINKNRWIDLGRLPRTKNGKYIDWKQSVGLEMPFQFDGVKSKIKLVDYGEAGKVFITIEKYVDEPIKIGTNWLTSCLLYRLVGNKVADNRPDLIKYFLNPSDAYRFSVYNKAFVNVVCPVCKRTKIQQVNNLCSRGFSCNICSDGVSLPNKIMYYVLEQCKIDFINEVSSAKGFDWIVKQYRYDFYFQTFAGEKILIEMDGGFHRTKEQQSIDDEKDLLAIRNGYKLIRIDCQYDNDPLNYIRNSIVNSELQKLLPLHMVNWDSCRQFLQTSLMQEACKLWEIYEYSTGDIAKQLKVTRPTIIAYLKRGKECNLCPSYNYLEAKNRKSDSYIALLQQEKIICVFRHFDQLCKQSLQLLGTYFHKPSVLTCSHRNELYKGYKIQHITKEEYEQYKIINNIEVVKKEVSIL